MLRDVTPPTSATPHAPVLVVDLDGTLIRTDLLFESALLLLSKNPLYVVMLAVWLFRGKKVLKTEIAARVELDATTLPYREDVIAFIKSERSRRDKIVLATASDQRFADAVAAHLGGFDAVHGTDTTQNLISGRKLALLHATYGENIAYMGDSSADAPLFAAVPEPYLVTTRGARPPKGAANVTFAERFDDEKKKPLKALLKALRPHQWAKNALIFVPLVLAHRITEVETWLLALAGFISFSLCASSVYVLNDLLDIQNDRGHHRKKTRPFASGALSIPLGVMLAPTVLGVAALIAAIALPMRFWVVLVAYYITTFAYSLWLKRMVLVDVLVLAGLYTVRIAAGAAAAAVPISYWLFAFSLFFFLNLAFVKRYIELLTAEKSGKALSGRGYRSEDIQVVARLGAAAGYVSILVLALYINSADVVRLYAFPKILWFLLPIMLYWVSRVWLIAGRDEMHDDPIVFALKDRASYVCVVLLVAVLLAAKLVTAVPL